MKLRTARWSTAQRGLSSSARALSSMTTDRPRMTTTTKMTRRFHRYRRSLRRTVHLPLPRWPGPR
jgi:hypothetical protein